MMRKSLLLLLALSSAGTSFASSSPFDSFECRAYIGDLGAIDESQDLVILSRDIPAGDQGHVINYFAKFKNFSLSASIVPQSETLALISGTITSPSGLTMQTYAMTEIHAGFTLLYGNEAVLACAGPDAKVRFQK